MKLYYFDVLNPRKACAVARYLGSPVEYVYLDPLKGEHKTPQYLAINPNGKVPALTDGNLNLWESNAIMCHLAQKAGSDLWPGDGQRQIDVMRWLSWNAEHFTQQAGNLYFQFIVKPRFNLGPADAASVEESQGYLRSYGAMLDDHLQGRKFLLGDTLTIADFAVAVTLPYAERAQIPLDDFTAIQRWHGRLNELPAWREPFPQRVAAVA